MKNIHVARGSKSLDYDDLCIHPDVDMSIGYKPPNVDIIDGTGDPHAHLRAYCDMLVGVGRNEKLRMKLFMRILTVEAHTCYTRQDPETRESGFTLVNLQKKSSESFQEYARRWRSEAARAQPPLDDSELTKYFIKAQ
nr:uncharacterized protein LOC117280156 [Nicotiana tomentosiformis]